jgi:hypothetical protein
MTFDPCSLPASKPVEIMDDLDALARLTARLENLERRVSALEHPTETSASVPAAPVKPAEPVQHQPRPIVASRHRGF